MAKFNGTFVFRSIPTKPRTDHAFAVTAVLPNGQQVEVGTVTETKIRHMRMMTGWIAEAPNGHRGCHRDQAHAAAALLWDGQSYETLVNPLV